MNAKLNMVLSMLIFGTVGIFVKYINMPSGLIAMVRGFVGMLIIAAAIKLSKQKINFVAIKQKLFLLILSGAVMGFNWILLFESYNYTSVAVATVCYYMAPIFVIITSPFILKEKLSAKKIVCVAVALIGSVLVSGVLKTGVSGLKGIFLALGAAALYATVVIINKFLSDLSAYEKTAFQLGAAAITVAPYALSTMGDVKFNTIPLLLLFVVGILHTGLAYTLYFGAIPKLKAQTVAILSYIDPSSAVLLSAVILKEKITVFELIGAILIIGAAFVSEVQFKKLDKTN